MNALMNHGFLRYAKSGHVSIVAGDIYVSPTMGAPLPGVRIGSLADQIRSFAQAAAPSFERASDRPLVSAARRMASNLHILRFCTTELLDFLQERSSNSQPEYSQAAQVSDLLASMARNYAELDRSIKSCETVQVIGEQLQRHLGSPCIISRSCIRPLREVSTGRPDAIRVGDTYFLPDDSHVQSLDGVAKAIRGRIQASSTVAGGNQQAITALADSIVEMHARVLHRYPLTIGTHCRILFRDEHYQLLHQETGDFVLVRGPVEHRLHQAVMYVALRLQGRSRSEMLSMPPMVVHHLGNLWNPARRGSRYSMCMGDGRQYGHLKSKRFTDSEAIALWLEAGVIVATARPEFNAMLLGERDSQSRRRGIEGVLRRIRLHD